MNECLNFARKYKVTRSSLDIVSLIEYANVISRTCKIIDYSDFEIL